MLAAFVLLFGLTAGSVHVSQETSTFRDDQNRAVFFHGLNYVNKDAPYYPTITDVDIVNMKSIGTNLIRLGVMMSGVFPSNSTPDTAYLDQIEAVITCLLYTSDAADDLLCVDLGGRRIIKKKITLT
eukprot:TRINITY_DN21539_c0_g1_i1.p1 TRINITY_DN21539_c0_g1~~TRINITY_DN21539_c0_g1_i1.p1  ORF type:complete len:127 (+),score=54.64 TRINITY_DN21539_c0_g1_i1:35-415(+)